MLSLIRLLRKEQSDLCMHYLLRSVTILKTLTVGLLCTCGFVTAAFGAGVGFDDCPGAEVGPGLAVGAGAEVDDLPVAALDPDLVGVPAAVAVKEDIA